MLTLFEPNVCALLDRLYAEAGKADGAILPDLLPRQNGRAPLTMRYLRRGCARLLCRLRRKRRAALSTGPDEQAKTGRRV